MIPPHQQNNKNNNKFISYICLEVKLSKKPPGYKNGYAIYPSPAKKNLYKMAVWLKELETS